MSLSLQINEDLKKALKSKDELVLSVLRMAVAAIINEQIRTKKKELTDEEVLKILFNEAKKRKDSITAYEKGGRLELADKEKQELIIIQKYLPQQLSEEQVTVAIKEVIAANPGLDFGPLMGKIMGQLKGKADGNLVQKILKQEIS